MGAAADQLGQSVIEALKRLGERPLAPGLYLVATPIGNLADVTLRALSVLSRADVVYCEDTRHSRRLFERYGLTPRVKPYHEHNAERERPQVIAALVAGEAVALISDAGTPLVSDPGYKLVVAALDAGHRVEAIPGPSAVLSALSVSGLPTDSFFFAGFLPAKSGQRHARLAELAAIPATLVIFEAPGRVAATLSGMAGSLGDRPAVVARELTKLHEDVRRGPLSTLARLFEAEPPRGECVILAGPPPAEAEVGDTAIADALTTALARSSVRDAVREVSEALKAPRHRVYQLALALRSGDATST